MWSPSLRFCCCDKTLPNSSMGRTVFASSWNFRVILHLWEKSGSHLSRDHGGILLIDWLSLTFLATYMAQDYLPRSGTIHSGLDTFPSINSQGKSHTDKPTGQSDGGSCSVEVPSSYMTLIYAMLIKTNHCTWTAGLGNIKKYLFTPDRRTTIVQHAKSVSLLQWQKEACGP